MQLKELTVSIVTALFELAVAIGGLVAAVSWGLEVYLSDYSQTDPENMKGVVVNWIGAGFMGVLGIVALLYFFETFRDMLMSYLQRVVEKPKAIDNQAVD
jgi:hypothetical protein